VVAEGSVNLGQISEGGEEADEETENDQGSENQKFFHAGPPYFLIINVALIA